jgi:hypothetical protein
MEIKFAGKNIFNIVYLLTKWLLPCIAIKKGEKCQKKCLYTHVVAWLIGNWSLEMGFGV